MNGDRRNGWRDQMLHIGGVGRMKITMQGVGVRVDSLRGVDGGLVSSRKGRRQIFAGHTTHRILDIRMPSENATCDTACKEERGGPLEKGRR